MKERVKNIAIILIGIISITSLTVSAATLINSKEVVYDNTASGLRSTTVQGAVDELYSAATDYSTLNNKIKNMETTIINKIYPVGSIYMSTTEDTIEKVQDRFGGEWERYSEGRTLVAAGTITDDTGNIQTYIAGDTGGSATTTLQVANLPSHNHAYTPSGTNSYTTSAVSTGKQSADHTHDYSGTVAKNGEHTPTFASGGVAMVLFSTEAYSGYPEKEGFVGGTNGWWNNVNKNASSLNKIASHNHTYSGTTVKQSADHTHSITAANLKTAIGTITFTGTQGNTSNTGSGTSFSNESPYTVIYMYKRVN